MLTYALSPSLSESAFGGSLDVNTRPLLPILPLTIQPWNVEPEIPADVIDSCAYAAQASCAPTQVLLCMYTYICISGIINSIGAFSPVDTCLCLSVLVQIYIYTYVYIYTYAYTYVYV
jgi:hypothetical protein